jgi:hypothetical protein
MNEYTKEELLILNDMVDANYDNPNIRHALLTHTDDYGIERLFSKKDIMENRYDYTLRMFIGFLEPDWYIGILNPTIGVLIREEPLETIPLYINNNDNRGLVARWRLQIGK